MSANHVPGCECARCERRAVRLEAYTARVGRRRRSAKRDAEKDRKLRLERELRWRTFLVGSEAHKLRARRVRAANAARQALRAERRRPRTTRPAPQPAPAAVTGRRRLGHYCRALGHRWSGWKRRGDALERDCERGSCRASERKAVAA